MLKLHMSLDQDLSSSRKALGKSGEQGERSNSSSSSPNKSSLKVLGRSHTSAGSQKTFLRSPIRRQRTVNNEGPGGTDLDPFIPFSSGPKSVDSPDPSQAGSPSSPKSSKTAVVHTWKSLCKDKTKDLFRKWKTLPEGRADFDKYSPSASLDCYQEGGGGGIMVNPSGSGRSTPSKTRTRKEQRGESSGNIMHAMQGLSIKGVPVTTNNSSGGGNKSWSVHVWATYVQRDHHLSDDLTEDIPPPPRQHLSDFQKIKLTHFFRYVLDMNHDDVISAEDFVALNQRIRHYNDWSSECIEFHILKEVHSGFLECFLNQPLDEGSTMYYYNKEMETRSSVNIDEWLDVWGNLLHGARTLESFPLWLQYFPKILFQVINRSGSGIISREELRAFYTTFLGIDFRIVNDTLDEVYRAMTDAQGSLTYPLFKLCFTNFLLGKYPHGPGQYLFGICAKESIDCMFPIDYSAMNTSKEDLEPYDPEKSKEVNRRF